MCGCVIVRLFGDYVCLVLWCCFHFAIYVIDWCSHCVLLLCATFCWACGCVLVVLVDVVACLFHDLFPPVHSFPLRGHVSLKACYSSFLPLVSFVVMSFPCVLFVFLHCSNLMCYRASMRSVKTPGGRLVAQYVKKAAATPKCGDCGRNLIGVRAHITARAFSCVFFRLMRRFTRIAQPHAAALAKTERRPL